jgi:uncharacterized lipoprotein YbaY
MPAVADVTNQPSGAPGHWLGCYRERIALPPGAVPSVDSADIGEQAALTVWARTEAGTRVSDTNTPVLTRGAADAAEIVMRRVQEP